jgi:hypothetical protein
MTRATCDAPPTQKEVLMRLEGVKDFAAPREVVWSVIDDPAQMAGLMPGVEGFESSTIVAGKRTSRCRSGWAGSE